MIKISVRKKNILHNDLNDRRGRIIWRNEWCNFNIYQYNNICSPLLYTLLFLYDFLYYKIISSLFIPLEKKRKKNKVLPQAGIKFRWQSPKETVKRNWAMAVNLWNRHPEFFSSPDRRKQTERVREREKRCRQRQNCTDLQCGWKGLPAGLVSCQISAVKSPV